MLGVVLFLTLVLVLCDTIPDTYCQYLRKHNSICEVTIYRGMSWQ